MILCAGFGPALAGCSLLGLQWRYRYRLTGEVDTPGGVRTGSSVIEVVRDKGYSGIDGRARGEAVAIDLPGGQTLFLLLRGNLGYVDWAFAMPHQAFRRQLGSSDMVDGELLDKLERLQGAHAVLDRQYYPQMVRFRDIGDPESVEEVDPDKLAASFGSGVRLRRITVELTDAPVTETIEKRLGWLKPEAGATLDADFKPTTKPTLAQRLRFGDFVKGR